MPRACLLAAFHRFIEHGRIQIYQEGLGHSSEAFGWTSPFSFRCTLCKTVLLVLVWVLHFQDCRLQVQGLGPVFPTTGHRYPEFFSSSQSKDEAAVQLFNLDRDVIDEELALKEEYYRLLFHSY